MCSLLWKARLSWSSTLLPNGKSFPFINVGWNQYKSWLVFWCVVVSLPSITALKSFTKLTETRVLSSLVSLPMSLEDKSLVLMMISPSFVPWVSRHISLSTCGPVGSDWHQTIYCSSTMVSLSLLWRSLKWTGRTWMRSLRGWSLRRERTSVVLPGLLPSSGTSSFLFLRIYRVISVRADIRAFT